MTKGIHKGPGKKNIETNGTGKKERNEYGKEEDGGSAKTFCARAKRICLKLQGERTQ